MAEPSSLLIILSGGVFRGIGDSNTPLITVLIACICNIAGDLIMVAGFNLGTVGAAIATVAAQLISVAISFTIGVVMFYAAFFHGDILSGIFSKDADVIIASEDYLKAYGIGCLLTCFLFCFIGFFNGMGHTSFVMIQGIMGAFAVRVPVSFLMSKWEPVSLFHIGLATPCSTILQIVLCFGYLFFIRKYRGSKSL